MDCKLSLVVVRIVSSCDSETNLVESVGQLVNLVREEVVNNGSNPRGQNTRCGVYKSLATIGMFICRVGISS